MKHILLIVIGLSASLLKGQGLWPLQSPAGVVAYAGSLQWGPDGLLYTMIGSDGAVPIGQDTLDFVGFYSLACSISERELPLVRPKPVSVYDSSVRLRVPLAQAEANPAMIPQHFTNLHLG